MSCAKHHLDSGNEVDVISQLMASPSWLSLSGIDVLLKDKSRELPETVQAVLGLQSDNALCQRS